MTKVIGEFTANLPVPILTGPGILNLMNKHSSLSVNMHIDGSDVRVQLEGQTEPICNEWGDVDLLPRVKSFKVWITRDLPLGTDSEGNKRLSFSDERGFEQVLVKSVKRVVSIIKLKARQSSINTRHPVHSYDYKYHWADQSVGTMFSLHEGAHGLPIYMLDTFSFDVFSHELNELDEGMWEEVQTKVASSVEIPIFDELLHDAIVFRAAMNYRMAALSAAVSIEVLLSRIYETLLACNGTLKDCQVQRLNNWEKVKKIQELEPDIPILWEEIGPIFDERNRIAHGESLDTSREMMDAMINSCQHVRSVLSGLEEPH